MEHTNGIVVGMQYWLGEQRRGLGVPIIKFGSGNEATPLPELILSEREMELTIFMLQNLLDQFRKEKLEYPDMVCA